MQKAKHLGSLRIVIGFQIIEPPLGVCFETLRAHLLHHFRSPQPEKNLVEAALDCDNRFATKQKQSSECAFEIRNVQHANKYVDVLHDFPKGAMRFGRD